MYGEQGLTPSREIAGLLLSAILSDTLVFRSPTSTPQDEAAAKALAALAGETSSPTPSRCLRQVAT